MKPKTLAILRSILNEEPTRQAVAARLPDIEREDAIGEARLMEIVEWLAEDGLSLRSAQLSVKMRHKISGAIYLLEQYGYKIIRPR